MYPNDIYMFVFPGMSTMSSSIAVDEQRFSKKGRAIVRIVSAGTTGAAIRSSRRVPPAPSALESLARYDSW